MTITAILILLAGPTSARPTAATITQQAEIEFLMERADSAVRLGTGGQARMRMDELERKMGVRDDKGLIRVPTDDDLKKLRGFFSDQRGDYAEAARIYAQAQTQSHALFNEALAKAAQYYWTMPPQVSGFVSNGPPWDRGKEIVWAPHYAEPRLISKPGDRFEFESDDAINDLPAMIVNGRPEFRISAFKTFGGDFDAGILGSYLRHEQIHHNLLQTNSSDVDLRNTPGVERVLILTVMREQDVFQLDSEDWKKLFYNASGWAYLENQWEQRLDQGYDPYNPTDLNLQFNNISVPEARKVAIRDAADKDLGLFAELDGLIDAGQNTLALERVRTEGASDFLRAQTDDKIIELVRGWKNARQRDGEKSRIQKELSYAKLLAALRYEAELCDFEAFDNTNHYSFRFGFQDKIPSCSGCSKNVYYYTSATTLAAAKAAFLLTRACYDEGTRSPCNDSITAMQSRWNDADFRASLVLDASGGPLQNTCVHNLRDTLKLPFDSKDINKAIARYKKDTDREARRRTDEYYRRERDEARRRRREESGGSPPPQGGNPGWRQPCPNLDCVPATPW